MPAFVAGGLVPSNAHAHVGNSAEHAYYDFMFGIEVTLTVGSVWLLMIATGLFIGLRPRAYLTLIIPILILGVISGAVLGTFGWLPPDLPAYIAAVLIGLMAAAALKLDEWLFAIILLNASVIMSNVMFLGSDWQMVPLFLYVGVATVLVLGPVAVCSVIWLVRKYLPYGWVTIAWRALASWVVAIAVLMIALSLSGKA